MTANVYGDLQHVTSSKIVGHKERQSTDPMFRWYISIEQVIPRIQQFMIHIVNSALKIVQ
jgi:hypothetical protein